MTKRNRPYVGKSEAQANAEALARRDSPLRDEHQASVQAKWDFRRREPANLREAVYFARRAYADEVPDKLHDGPDAIGDGGTPRFAAKAEGYLFGRAGASDVQFDPETGLPDLVSYYHSPFRAALERLLRSDDPAVVRRGRIVSHVTIGQMGPAEAAIRERAHPYDAKRVAEDALRSFLRGLSDIKLHVQRTQEPLQEGETAA